MKMDNMMKMKEESREMSTMTILVEYDQNAF